jgi:single-strand DNA-binding protein
MASITIKGVVGKDPELKFISGPKGEFAVCNFSLADSQSRNKNGQWVDGITIWYNISVTGRQAEVAADAVSKGMQLKITGDLEITEYQAKDGTTKVAYNVKAVDISEPIKSQSRPKPKNDEPEWSSGWN